MTMKRNISLLVGALTFVSAIAQTSYTNFVNINPVTGVTVFPANDILNVTIDPEKPGALNINLKDNTQKQIFLGDSGKSKFINISPEQLLAELYSYQYYGLPYNNNGINSASPYTGKFDALTDLYQIHWSAQSTVNNYYSGNLNATKTPLMSYTTDLVWESVNKGLELIKNLESLDTSNFPARDSIMAETKCIIAQHYFDLFMHYGGLPIIKDIDLSNNHHMGDLNADICKPIIKYSNTPGIHNRCSVEETVEYMVNLLDEAIPHLKWESDIIYTLNTERIYRDSGSLRCIESRRWTQAGAMALKAKILLFAASPLFNADKPYYNQTSEQQKPLVWYGNYDDSRWQRALEACQDFFKALEAKGYYDLVKATSKTCESYRKAFRDGYWDVNSKEALMTSRVSELFGTQSTYCWLSWNSWNGINRLNHSPSEEYAEMFGWSDGTPFRWEEDSVAGRVDGKNGKLFFEYKEIRGGYKKTASRDPRMYENLICSGQQRLSEDGTAYGNPYELWRGGQDAAFNVIDADGNIVEAETSFCPTGYGAMKYVMSQEEKRRSPHHWVMLSLNEMYLMYAEALAQTGNLAEAIKYIDIIRDRVGLNSLATSYNTTYGIDLTTNKDLLLEEILRERACELGMSNNRFFDMVRYKRTDWMTRQLHGLVSIRMNKNANDEWEERNNPWFGDDRNNGLPEPTTFKFYRFPLQTCPRTLWGKDKDSDEVLKWLLSPLPQEEIDKGLGLIQNPGW